MDSDEEDVFNYGIDEEEEEAIPSGDRTRLYTILNVKPTASITEIKTAYRQLSKIYHPDRYTDASEKHDASIRFNELHYAYDVLLDPHRRAIYDNLGEEGLKVSRELIRKSPTIEDLKTKLEDLAYQKHKKALANKLNYKSDIELNCNLIPLFLPSGKSIDLGNGRVAMIPKISLMQRLQLIRCDNASFKTSYQTPIKSSIFSTLFKEEQSKTASKTKDPINKTILLLQTSASQSLVRQTGPNKQQVLARQQFLNLVLGIRQIVSYNFNFDIGFLAFNPQSVFLKTRYNPFPGLTLNTNLEASRLDRPPSVGFNISRQITKTGFLIVGYKTGAWCLNERWGSSIPIERRGLDSQYLIGWSQGDSSLSKHNLPLYNIFFTASPIQSGISVEHNRILKLSPESQGITTSLRLETSTMQNTFTAAFSRLFNKELSFGVAFVFNLTHGFASTRLECTRLGQRFSLPLDFGSVSTNYSILFWATVLPSIIYSTYDIMIERRQVLKKRRLRLQKRKEFYENRKLSAVKYLESIEKRAQEIQHYEKQNDGLLIEKATYGFKHETIDVTVLITTFVQHSRLYIPKNISLKNVKGIYDPCPHQKRKELKITYLFKGKKHYCIFKDHEEIIIPLRQHLSA